MSAAQYLPPADRTRAILEDLEAVRENLLALSDDIWAGIDRQGVDQGLFVECNLRPPDLGTGRVEGRRSYLLAETGFGRSSSERTR